MILLDTSVLIEWLKGTPKGLKLTKMCEGKKTLLSSITTNELLVGAKNNKEKMLKLISNFDVLPFSEKESILAADIENKLYKLGKPIPKLDIFIASIALANKITLLTTDKHFEYVQDLDKVIV